MKLVYKIWLDQRGKAYGDGPHELLMRVEKTGSLHKAAIQMRMAYSKAWRLIRTLEGRLGFLLLDRKAGGLSGGGSTVTPEAKSLMHQFDLFRRDVRKAMESLSEKHFGREFSIKKKPLKRGGYQGTHAKE